MKEIFAKDTIAIELFLLCFAIVFCFFQKSVFAEETIEYSPGSLIIKFHADAPNIKDIITIKHEMVKTSIESIDRLNMKYGAYSFKPYFRRKHPAERDARIGKDRKFVFQFPYDSDMRKIAAEYSKDINVEYACPNHVYSINVDLDDPEYLNGHQWALNKIGATGAWDVTQGSSNVIIGILDTGIDLPHPDLNDNLVSSAYWRDEVDTDTVAWKANEYTVFSTEDYDTPDGDPQEHVQAHGTHVSGIASAETDNGTGIAGLGWNCKIMPIRTAFWLFKDGQYHGKYDDDDVDNALDWAIDHNVDVINMSFGGYDLDEIPYEDMIIEAYNAGIVLVASSGNGNAGALHYYPACFEDYVIAVGATTENDARWVASQFLGSNYGTWLDLTAPGDNIRSTDLDSTYSYKTGTSMAAPHVAGLAALLLSKNSSLTPYEVERIMECTAKDLGDAGFDEYYGHGRIQAASALNLMVVPHDYATIESALSSASSGDTIFVGPGTYTPSSHLTVNSGVTLLMPCAGTAVKMGSAKNIDVNGGSIIAENVLFTYNGAGSPGAWGSILVRGGGSQASRITNCIIKFAYNGVYVNNTLSHQISGCTIDSCYNGIQGAYSGSFNCNNDTVKHCSNSGIRFILDSSPANISNTTIENNYFAGVYCEGSGPNIWNSRIKYNQRYGMYIHDFSVPDLASTPSQLQNMIYENDSIEVNVLYYSDPILGKNAGGYPSTQNVIKDDAGTLISLMYDCDVDAYYLWWGSSPPDSSRFYRYSNSYLNYYPWATSDPGWSGKAASMIADLSSPYQRAKIKLYEEKSKEAIALLKEQIESFPESGEARHALVKLYSLNKRNLYEDKDALITYLSYVIYSFPNLKPLALELAALDLTNGGYYQDVVDIYEYLIPAPESANEYVLGRAFHFYLYKLGSTERAGDYLSMLELAQISEPKMRDFTTEFEKTKDMVDPYIGEMKKNPLFSLTGYDLAKTTAQLPLDYKLYPVYPNPFNPSTTISFDLPEQAKVMITIYNVLGQKLATIINSVLAAGNHKYIWNASRFGSGIYFVRMEARDFVKTEKVTLLK